MFALSKFHCTLTPDQFPSWSFKGLVWRKSLKIRSMLHFLSPLSVSPNNLSMKTKHNLGLISFNSQPLSFSLLFFKLFGNHIQYHPYHIVQTIQNFLTFSIKILLPPSFHIRAACSSLVMTRETQDRGKMSVRVSRLQLLLSKTKIWQSPRPI